MRCVSVFIFALLFAASAVVSLAGIQVTKLEPPLLIGSYDELNIVAVDFNLDGQVDARILAYSGGATLYFDHPSRIIIRRDFYPWTTNIYGGTGALPLGTVIGSNLVTTLNTNTYIWHTGTTNRSPDDSVPFLSDHYSGMFGMLAGGFPGDPPVVFGDFAAKECVIAIEFLIGTNRHYGYIHCDFRKEVGYGWGGTGGYVLGWAYETQPDTAVTAAPISISPARFKCNIQPRGGDLWDIIWNATPGAAFKLQGSPALHVPFTDFTPEFVIPSGSSAASVVEVLTIEAPTNAPSYFWRVERTR